MLVNRLRVSETHFARCPAYNLSIDQRFFAKPLPCRAEAEKKQEARGRGGRGGRWEGVTWAGNKQRDTASQSPASEEAVEVGSIV